jgi:5-(carboxyamino)imidazole ribonucleotide synthase
VIRDRDSLADAWSILGSSPLIAEEMIAFDVEASAIGARNIAGEIISYPLTRNEHKEGILQTSRAPFGNAELTRLAQTYHARLADRLDYVGVLSLELFVVGDKLLANEFAPRVHNSGHWTIDGAVTSQFENHLRAVSDMPLADPSATGHVAMENLIGSLPVGLQAIRDAGFYVHEYGKAERPGRKLGHVTLVADNDSDRELRLKELRQIMFS